MKDLLLMSVTTVTLKSNTFEWFASRKWGFAISSLDFLMSEILKLNSDQALKLGFNLISHGNVHKHLGNSKKHDFEENNLIEKSIDEVLEIRCTDDDEEKVKRDAFMKKINEKILNDKFAANHQNLKNTFMQCCLILVRHKLPLQVKNPPVML